MRPDERELDEEIRGHLAISVKERIERGEDPEAARLAALREFGYVPAIRESMRRVWHSRWFDAAHALRQEMRIGAALAPARQRSRGDGRVDARARHRRQRRDLQRRSRRPAASARQSRRRSARLHPSERAGLGAANITFSVPEIDDFKSRVTTIGAFGDFSTIDFTMLGLGDPRVVHAGVVSGSYFEVMGLRPVLGRLLNASDDGPNAAGVAVLTHRFWTTSLDSDPSGHRQDDPASGTRSATVVGVLEPSMPYPADTEIIANVVTSPHHLGATMVTERTHRMTELFGRLKPGASLEDARAELTAVHAAMMREHPEAYSARADVRAERHAAARSDYDAGTNDPAGAACRGRHRLHHCLLERRQPDSGALGPA